MRGSSEPQRLNELYGGNEVVDSLAASRMLRNRPQICRNLQGLLVHHTLTKRVVPTLANVRMVSMPTGFKNPADFY